MQTLRNVSTFNLTLGDLVQARVMALNSNGWSEISEPNVIGCTIETEPGIMSPPIKVVSQSSSTQISLTWQPVSNTGGSTIDSYNLQTDGGSN